MKRLFYLIIMFNMCAIGLYSQSLETQNVGSAGTFISNGNGGLHYNIGETVIFQDSQIRSGVLQFFNISTLVENDFDVQSISVYPNPTTGPLTISHDYDHITEWVLTNLQGQPLQATDNTGASTNLTLENMTPGTYFIIPISEGRPLTAYQIQLIR